MRQSKEDHQSQEKRILEIPPQDGSSKRHQSWRMCARGWQGSQGSHARNTSSNVPWKASKLGACKDLEGHIFTIGLGNEGKDEDMQKSKQKMATYIGTKYGDNAAQEWTSKKCMVLKELTNSLAIETRHAERVRVTRGQLNQKTTSFLGEQNEILKEIVTKPNNQDLVRDRQEINDQILKCVRLTSTMRLRWNSLRTIRWPTAMCGAATIIQLRVLRRAEGKCTCCCLVNLLKCWSIRWSRIQPG